MTPGFDKDYWERHWRHGPPEDRAQLRALPPNPHLVRESGGLAPGSALDAGCGTGTEALWLASRGWRVVAVDISAAALAQAAARLASDGPSGAVEWVEADLTSWEPGRSFDLVTSHYTHPELSRSEFFGRLASWVAPGGTLLVVAHAAADPRRRTDDHPDHRHGPPAETTVTAAEIRESLDPAGWRVETAETQARTAAGHGGGVLLSDVIVRATRRNPA